MKSFSATIDIDAAPEAVWTILVATEGWVEFDPYCEKIEGRAAPGATLTAYSKLAPGRAFPVTVTTFERPSAFTWSNSMLLGALKSVRTHTISPNGSGSRFDLKEKVSGPMGLILSAAIPDLDEPFTAFCKGLKARVEGAVGAGSKHGRAAP